MNKDLMMKAAVKFKGVWPENELCEINDQRIGLCLGSYSEGDKEYEKGGFYPVGCEAMSSLWSIVCSREEFEDFVESLFEGAPNDATHIGNDGLFYKLGAMSTHFLNSCTKKWALDGNGKDWLSKNLIPRPIAKDKPDAPYMPRVEVEVLHEGRWVGATTVGEFDGSMVCAPNGGGFYAYEPDQIRPLRTDREIFIEQAIEDSLEQVSSDEVDTELFIRIFGAMYDKGYYTKENK